MRKLAVLCLFYVDTVLHGVVIVGWSSIRQMLEDEGFFLNCADADMNCQDGLASQSRQTSQIFQYSMMLCGAIQCWDQPTKQPLW